jgi:hypothetical protein
VRWPPQRRTSSGSGMSMSAAETALWGLCPHSLTLGSPSAWGSRAQCSLLHHASCWPKGRMLIKLWQGIPLICEVGVHTSAYLNSRGCTKKQGAWGRERTTPLTCSVSLRPHS